MFLKNRKYLALWDLTRIIKLLFGVILLIGFILEKDSFYFVFSLFFLIQSIFNVEIFDTGNYNTNTDSHENKSDFISKN